MKYLRLLAPLDWAHLPARPAGCYRGVRPRSRVPFVAAYLVKLEQNLRSVGALRQFLLDHPVLAWLLGFGRPPVIPPEREWARILRNLDNSCLQLLLDQSILAIRQALPPPLAGASFGAEVALDTKHILAWVKENNPKEYVPDRFNKQRQPKGDPDCKLGCKTRTNQRGRGPAAPTTEGQPASGVAVGTFYWGYASGIVVTKLAGFGEVVLAEYTQPFNAGDTTYFFPLLAQVERRLGRRPRTGALDAAFDTFYVYDYFAEAGGFAAVPRAQRGKLHQTFDAAGQPCCAAQLAMVRKHAFIDRKGVVPQPKARYACPLLYPAPTGEVCPLAHPAWAKGGCILTFGTTPGARLRHELDRERADFKALYAQRTACERLFSQAVALGIERPKLRNQRSITNFNTLLYVLLNLRTLQRIQQLGAIGQ
jgi:hypothetical protein